MVQTIHCPKCKKITYLPSGPTNGRDRVYNFSFTIRFPDELCDSCKKMQGDENTSTAMETDIIETGDLNASQVDEVLRFAGVLGTILKWASTQAGEQGKWH